MDYLIFIYHHHQKLNLIPHLIITMYGFQMREAVIVFATENKYGAQVRQIPINCKYKKYQKINLILLPGGF